MKKTIIAALVGGIILFLWQFLSWGQLNLHQPAQQYTEKQEAILQFLQDQGLSEGGYLLPSSPENTTPEEYNKQLQAAARKPWATIQYHQEQNTNMGMNMMRGLIINMITVWLLCWIITRMRNRSFAAILTASLFSGLIVFFNVPYTTAIWYPSFDIWADFADAVLGWGLCGLWLAWYLKQHAAARVPASWTEVPATMNLD